MNRRNFLKLASYGLTAGSALTLPSTKVLANEYDVLYSSGEVTAESLQFVREEEKLARDVYITLYKKWNSGIFNNISYSEQTHTDKVRLLLEKYNIFDPAAGKAIGEFVNPKISDYYKNLISRGHVSKKEALYVGAYIEELDIGDLRHEINQATSREVKQVYSNLMYGSYNHLKAFVGQIQRLGITYKAQLLEQSDVDRILAL